MRMRFTVGDITKQLNIEAIVNSANMNLSGTHRGSVDAAIHEAAGPQLDEYCKHMNGCDPGYAKASPAFNLPYKYIIHTVAPQYAGGCKGEDRILSDAYLNILHIAYSYGVKRIAFPAISIGSRSFPVEQAAEIALTTIKNYCDSHPDAFNLIRFVLTDNNILNVFEKTWNSIKETEANDTVSKKPKNKNDITELLCELEYIIGSHASKQDSEKYYRYPLTYCDNVKEAKKLADEWYYETRNLHLVKDDLDDEMEKLLREHQKSYELKLLENIQITRQLDTIDTEAISSMHYKFGYNILNIGEGLLDVIKFLEDRYNIDIYKLEKNLQDKREDELDERRVVLEERRIRLEQNKSIHISPGEYVIEIDIPKGEYEVTLNDGAWLHSIWNSIRYESSWIYYNKNKDRIVLREGEKLELSYADILLKKREAVLQERISILDNNEELVLEPDSYDIGKDIPEGKYIVEIPKGALLRYINANGNRTAEWGKKTLNIYLSSGKDIKIENNTIILKKA